MKTEFLGWYDNVALAVQPEVADARLVAVQAAAASATHERLEALIRAAFRCKQHSSAMTATVRTKLAGKGDALLDEEFKLLSAATLAVVLRAGKPMAARAATMVYTTHFGGLRSVKQPMDLVGLAIDARLALARTTRRRPALLMPAMPSLEINTTKAVGSADHNERLELLAEACTAAMTALAERQADFEQRATQYINIQDEELNMLWWLQGGHSDSLNLPFTDIPHEQRPFVLARELADATFAIPGAAAVESLFARAGIGGDEPIEIAAAIQALPTDWLKSAIPEADAAKVSPITTPLHEAFKRRLEVHGENTWIANWASVCEVDGAAKLTPLQLADLSYCEQLIIRK